MTGNARVSRQTSAVANVSTRELAIVGIKRLQDAIEKEYGMKLLIGAELEFSVTPTSDAGAQTMYALKADPSMNKRAQVPAPFFSGRGRVKEIYSESAAHQFEMVLGHERGDALSTAHALVAARKLVERQAPKIDLQPHFTALHPLREKVPFNTTNGMQISISLIQPDGVNAFSQDMDTDDLDSVNANAFAIAMLPMIRSTMLLHAPNKESYKRFAVKSSGDAPTEFTNLTGVVPKVDVNGFNGRVETRIAGADADPYLVVLATLAATYAALQSDTVHVRKGIMRCEASEDIYHSEGKIPKTRDEAEQEFRKDNRFRMLMNNLTRPERLGDQLCEAVLYDIHHAPKPTVKSR